ncbi:MAG: hypothetical protein QF654_03210 [Alphaproteobacteria bacterium]|jgi:dienelactone hydrolase|nr:hypothetical protein [Alphaproteobacteria bacterium]
MKRAILTVALSLVFVVCQTANATADTYNKAYDKAATYGKPTKGIVLHLHGCRELRITESWLVGWRDLLVQNGYKVVAPDSFDDSRPEHMCPSNEWRTLEDILEVFEIRSKQTSHAIEQIKKSYPGKKLFVWGYSEGAFIANRVTENVDGVVTTGGVCQDLRVDVPPDVPLLVIIGADDEAIGRYLRRKEGKYASMEDLCQRTMASENREWLIVGDMGHEAPLVFPKVKTAITKFFDIQN